MGSDAGRGPDHWGKCMKTSKRMPGRAARNGFFATMAMSALLLILPGAAMAVETTITSGPEDGELVTVDSVTFTFTSDEPGATFDCSIDLRGFKPCTSPVSMTDLEDGRHSFAVRADGDSTPDVRKFKVEVPDEPTGPTAACTAARKAQTSARARLNKAKARKATTRKAKRARSKAIAEATSDLKKANLKAKRNC